VVPLTPKLTAINWSRISPVTRDASVSSEMVEAALSRFIEWGREGAGL
jgi:hypothetical protein